MNQKELLQLELGLLKLWKESKVVDRIYQYKRRIKIYEENEDRYSAELFYDLTSGAMFLDVQDIASTRDGVASEFNYSLDEIIEKVEKRIVLSNIEVDNTIYMDIKVPLKSDVIIWNYEENEFISCECGNEAGHPHKTGFIPSKDFAYWICPHCGQVYEAEQKK